MNQITRATFEQAVAQYFGPLAGDNHWPLIRVSDEIFEIRSPLFVMQIRFGIGMHSRNIDTVLIPANQNLEMVKAGKGSFGVLAIAGYNGVDMEIMPKRQTEAGFLEYAEYVANCAKQFGLPYMLGQKSDCENVREYWRNESEKELEKIRGYKFPPNVQKRWHLPPEFPKKD
jgi:hypothetical protein